MAVSSSDVEPPPIIPWGASTLYVILSCSLMAVMGVSLISPVLPAIRGAFEISDAQVGLVITAYTLPGIFLTPFMGLIADRIGRRRTIIPLLFVYGATGAGITLTTSFTTLLLLRFLQGIGAGALMSLSVTLIGDIYEGSQRDAIIGLNGSMTGTGAALYPLIGGVLAGIHWKVPFLLYGFGIVVGLMALLALPEPSGTSVSEDVGTYLSQLSGALVHPQAVAVFGALLIGFFMFYGIAQTALPLLLNDKFRLTTGEIGFILALPAVALAIVSTQHDRLSRWRNTEELLSLGFVTFGISLLGLSVAPSPFVIALSLLILGAAFGLLMPSADTALVTLVPSRLRAGTMGMRTSVMRLGQTIGPVAFTYLAVVGFETPTIGYRVLIFISGVAIFIIGIGGYTFLRR
ncbi:MFS transporter [Halobellus rufus]|uniref:MFS transporter n=1 Tax=Halobellus rufus TaxID=1448860 RepID=UPI0009DF9940|nr:MFS transporter [Halobellus rufus]